MTGGVHVEQAGAVACVTLDNPGKLNAISVAMWRGLREAFERLPRVPGLRCIVLRGAGGVFAAGADIAEFPSFRFDESALRDYHESIVAPALDAMDACDVPVVAQIDGACVGGGLEVAACCDIRLCASSSRFGIPIARLGFPMAPDELRRVWRLAGRDVVADLLLQARIIEAAEAQRRGLVHQVVADGQVAHEAQATAERIAALPPQVARINKQTLRQLAQGGPTPAEQAAHFRYAATHDHREGITAFLERRAPRFQGD